MAERPVCRTHGHVQLMMRSIVTRRLVDIQQIEVLNRV